MARRSATHVKRDASFLGIFKSSKVAFAFGLIIMDALLVALIITYVPYTKIDWDAYMSQVSGFLEGERDYSNLKGDTGPLVYPAGFLYVYSAIQYITGGEVYSAQIFFAFLYLINLGIVLSVYVKTDVLITKFCMKKLKGKFFTGKLEYIFCEQHERFRGLSSGSIWRLHYKLKLPWWGLSLLCLSKRVHSIFVLRLFNDCFAMTFLHAALALLLDQRWHLGLIIFSVAVSIKMNVLLYAPPLFLLLLKALGIFGVISTLASAALVQILFGFPFLISHPVAYVSRAFNLGRVFIHFWSVNFKFVPEPVFVSKGFAISLLTTHLVVLAAFSHYRWCKHEGGLLNFLHSRYVAMKMKFAGLSSSNSSSRILKKEHIVTTMFAGNFIGIVCARSLHYQFYLWYFYSLPYLLWRTPFPTLLRRDVQIDFVYGGGVMLECLPFEHLFISSPSVSPLSHTVWIVVRPNGVSLCRRQANN
ncbi:hypothetical protein WN943_017146 [Citrus x changshan-huyou]